MPRPDTPFLMTMSLGQLASAIDAALKGGDPETKVCGCAPIDTAGPDEVTFLANSKYAKFAESTEAAAVIVGPGVSIPDRVVSLVADDPYFAFREAMIELHGFREHPGAMDCACGSCISLRAAIHERAMVGAETVAHPFAVVEAGATVGERCVLYPGSYVGADSIVGDDCVLHPGVVVYDRCVVGNRVILHANTVIGQDGFGHATHAGAHHKIPQQGIVVIEDDVELGASCAIERATMGETRIRRGTKFADLISIGHGTTVGEHCLFVSLVGVAGSVDVGKYVVLGGQVGVSGHLRIGDFVQAAGKTAIISDVPEGMKVGGIPAVEFKKAMRNVLVGNDLGGLAKRVKQLEARIKQLEAAEG